MTARTCPGSAVLPAQIGCHMIAADGVPKVRAIGAS
jgi:hypothetical protein